MQSHSRGWSGFWWLLALSPLVILYFGFQRPHGPFWALRDVYPVDHDHAWAGGTAGVFYTSDAGVHWRRILHEIGFERKNTGIFNSLRVGRILYADRGRAFVSLTDGVGVVVPNSGVTEVRRPSAAFWGEMHRISFVDSEHGWAFGTQPTGSLGKANDFRVSGDCRRSIDDYIYSTSDGGRTWLTTAVTTGIYSMFAVSQDVVWVTAECNQLIFTHDGGRTWSTRALVTGNILFADRDHAVITRVHDAIEPTDSSFTLVRLPVVPETVSFTSRDEIWGVNNEGRVLHSDDAGRNWTPTEAVVTRSLTFGLVRSRLTGEAWAVNRDGIAYFITDHGKQVRRTRVAYSLGWDWLPYHM